MVLIMFWKQREKVEKTLGAHLIFTFMFPGKSFMAGHCLFSDGHGYKLI